MVAWADFCDGRRIERAGDSDAEIGISGENPSGEKRATQRKDNYSVSEGEAEAEERCVLSMGERGRHRETKRQASIVHSRIGQREHKRRLRPARAA